MEDLDHRDIDDICRAARAYRLDSIKKDEIETALGYFENNVPGMRSHWFRSCGLLVGSGAVEAGCKPVIGAAPQALRHALDRRGRTMTAASSSEDRI
jgi:hypothetical protein